MNKDAVTKYEKCKTVPPKSIQLSRPIYTASSFKYILLFKSYLAVANILREIWTYHLLVDKEFDGREDFYLQDYYINFDLTFGLKWVSKTIGTGMTILDIRKGRIVFLLEVHIIQIKWRKYMVCHTMTTVLNQQHYDHSLVNYIVN